MRIDSRNSWHSVKGSIVAAFLVISRVAIAHEYINDVTDMGRTRLPSALLAHVRCFQYRVRSL